MFFINCSNMEEKNLYKSMTFWHSSGGSLLSSAWYVGIEGPNFDISVSSTYPFNRLAVDHHWSFAGHSHTCSFILMIAVCGNERGKDAEKEREDKWGEKKSKVFPAGKRERIPQELNWENYNWVSCITYNWPHQITIMQ